MSDSAIITFIKNPELGKVKTRLAKTVGDHQALRIYRALLQHTREQCAQVAAHRYVYYSSFIDEQDAWSTQQFHKRLQTGSDLGARMTAAFRAVLQKHDRAIIIGSDCATLTSDLLQQALDDLAQHDMVLGPAQDGGYYLLGMNRPFSPRIFADIQWSTAAVLPSTLSRMQELQVSYKLLPTLSDIDTEADWQQYGWPL